MLIKEFAFITIINLAMISIATPKMACSMQQMDSKFDRLSYILSSCTSILLTYTTTSYKMILERISKVIHFQQYHDSNNQR